MTPTSLITHTLFLRSDSVTSSPELQRITSIQRDFPLIEATALQPSQRLFNHPAAPMNANSQRAFFQLENLSLISLYNTNGHTSNNSHTPLGLTAISTYQQPLTRPYLDETIETAIQTNEQQVIRNWLQTPLVEIDATNSAEETALQIAARHNRLEIAQLLLQNGANINAANDTLGYPAIHLAIINHHQNMVVKLVQAGSSLTLRNDANCSNAIKLSKRHLNPTFTLWFENLKANHLDCTKKDQAPALIATLLRTKHSTATIPFAQLPFQDFHKAEWIGCFSAAIAEKKYNFAAILLAGGLPISVDDLTPDIKNQLHQTLWAYKNQYATLRTQLDKDITYSVFEFSEALPPSILRALLAYPLEILKKK